MCGTMWHRPSGAACTNQSAAQVEDFELRTFDAKRDRWNGYDAEDWVKQAER